MHKSVLFLLCISTLSHAMDYIRTQKTSKDQPLYLVVGSTRDNTHRQPYLITQLWQDNKADLSHNTTYKSRATTFDLKESCTPNTQHLVGDARTHLFKKNSIKAAYLERLPTFGICTTQQNIEPIETEVNYLGDCIQNIGKAMKRGAKIEVEWHPFLQFTCQNPETLQSIFNQKDIEISPFSGSIDMNLACIGFDMAQGKIIPKDLHLPEKFLACAQTLSTTLKKLLDFYIEKNVGTKELLCKRIDEEIWLWTTLIREHKIAVLPHGPSANFEDFSKAVACFHLVHEDISKKKRAVLELSGEKLYDANSFANNALFCFMLCDATIIHNKAHVKTFMKNNGFKNVKIKRTTSKHNSRENVWIIEGIKA